MTTFVKATTDETFAHNVYYYQLIERDFGIEVYRMNPLEIKSFDYRFVIYDIDTANIFNFVNWNFNVITKSEFEQELFIEAL